jgi:hypothetical protein
MEMAKLKKSSSSSRIRKNGNFQMDIPDTYSSRLYTHFFFLALCLLSVLYIYQMMELEMNKFAKNSLKGFTNVVDKCLG